MSLLNDRFGGIPLRARRVSILVLVDVALELYPLAANWSGIIVSILVLVDVALELRNSGLVRSQDTVVSILVLVDVALELNTP